MTGIGRSVSLDIRQMSYDRGTPLMSGLKFEVVAGEYVALVGASGAGKTTLLRMIAGLERSYDGEIHVGDALVTAAGRDRQMVFQDTRLLPWLNAAKNVAFAASSIDRKAALKKAATLLERVGLLDRAFSWPSTLSGGERSRVGLARAMMEPPAVLLLDEPLTGLDLAARFSLIKLLHDMRENIGFTCIIVSHDVYEATLLADRVLVMSARPLSVARSFRVDVPYPRNPGDPRISRVADEVTRAALDL